MNIKQSVISILAAVGLLGVAQAYAAPAQAPADVTAWSGVYKGTLPCADCSDVAYTINLLPDNTFLESKTYQGSRDGLSQPIITKGTFSWKEKDTKILFSNGDQYLISPSSITMLNSTGQLVSGPMGAMYVFKKVASN